MSKYAPLGRYLGDAGAGEVSMSFAEIETVLGFSLPPSARAYAPWLAGTRRAAAMPNARVGS